MSGFSEAWLSLRESADHAARATVLDHALVDWLKQRDACATPTKKPFCILDLGAGTGSNLRYLASRLLIDQHWILIDHDVYLLQTLPARLSAWARARAWEYRQTDLVRLISDQGYTISIERRRLDLAADLERIPFADADLVTASALLDLVSASWIGRVCHHCRRQGAAVFTVLNVDGRAIWRPEIIDDSWVRSAVSRHQLSDKGIGAALGTEAASYAQSSLAALGFEVRHASSDWWLGNDSSELQLAFAAGWAEAAAQIHPSEGDRVHMWLQDRRRWIDAGVSSLRVGHVDVLGLPAG